MVSASKIGSFRSLALGNRTATFERHFALKTHRKRINCSQKRAKSAKLNRITAHASKPEVPAA
jgi:hypothetical protein